MRLHTVIVVTALALIAGAHSASAQDVRGTAFGGVTGDVNGERYPAFGGGVLVDLGQPWISAGGQGEAFMSWPYFAGRGAVFGQATLAPKQLIRPFVMGGVGFGEDSGPMFGGGIEVRAPGQRYGFRVAVEDYVVRINGFDRRTTTHHQVALRVGILF
jgi:hypothetical protein